jgi:four helix bundle protein
MTNKDLEAWKKSIALVTVVHQINAKFPREEICGLESQIRRSAVSVLSIISERVARAHRNEFKQFINNSI